VTGVLQLHLGELMHVPEDYLKCIMVYAYDLVLALNRKRCGSPAITYLKCMASHRVMLKPHYELKQFMFEQVF
jgi:hypothetical protein